MAIAQAYPLGTPKTNDLLVGTSIPAANTNEKPITKNFSVGNILALGNAPNVVTTTFTITDAQLRTLGTNPVTLLDLNGAAFVGEYLQLISASFESINGSSGSSYTWAAGGAEISYAFGVADSNSFLIPQLYLPNGSAVTQLPYTIAARDGRYQRGSSLMVMTATNPVVVGEPNGSLVINLTYTFGSADSNSFLIPQLDLPNGSAVTQLPYTIAARDGKYQRGASLDLYTATNPVVVGEPNGSLVINLTYRLFPQI